MAQLVPFQCSASVKRPLWRKSPTAVQPSLGRARHAPGMVEPAPGGFGIGSACHTVLALAAAAPDSTAQITTAALTTTLFTGASPAERCPVHLSPAGQSNHDPAALCPSRSCLQCELTALMCQLEAKCLVRKSVRIWEQMSPGATAPRP